jgi:8-oxo-dGTP pyrophosphatase MutT (NUDIX family)
MMFRIDHQVWVFVFQVLDRGIEYLLLRQKPTVEWPFGPVIGTIRPEEHVRDTVLREVQEETGIERPVHLIDLVVPQKELFGDIGLVEWPFAYQAGAPSSPLAQVKPGPTVGDFAWMSFPKAFEEVGSDRDREALVRLQVQLQG